MDVLGSNTADFTPVILFTCHGAFDQQWNIVDRQIKGIGTQEFAGVNKGLDVLFVGTANGTRVQLFACNGTSAQVWSVVNGQIINSNFRGVGSGKCIDKALWRHAADLAFTDKATADALEQLAQMATSKSVVAPGRH